MKTKTLRVGIMPYEKFKKYTIAIASGSYKPKRNEPKVWFNSIETCSQVLSTKNMELLRLIEEQKPQSITELAGISGRKKSNLSRTLKTFTRYGIVDLIEKNRTKVPVAKATRFKVHHDHDLPAGLLD